MGGLTVLHLKQERIGGHVVWCVAEAARELPPGSWAKFTSEHIARNFMHWLTPLDTEGLIRRLVSGASTDADRQLYALILQRREHASRVDASSIAGDYWQRYYPHARF